MDDIPGILRQLTLEEKAALCAGRDCWYLVPVQRLGVPTMMVADGPHGLRKQIGDPARAGLGDSLPATCFPTASALAATWNRELIRQVGAALAEECRQEKVSVILGPGLNIKRSPLCGRNFEYFSEDPYLTGQMAKSFIQGVQSRGVGTSVKHFAANNQETRRMTGDSIVDERALREIYLAGFETAVKEAQPWTVMCSYNRINGVYASDHRTLMNDILREEWGFEGLVMTDWGAMNDRVQALQAGVDLEMPGPAPENAALITAAVRAGTLAEAVLDRAVERILTLIQKSQANASGAPRYDQAAHHALARRAAGEGAVLLKNEGGLLPLHAGQRITLIGRFAKQPRYQGAGSSQMHPSRLDNLYDELAQLVGEAALIYAPGYTESGEATDETLIGQALQAAAQADVVIVCAGLTAMYEIEGLDRRHLHLPAGHTALIRRLAAAHPRLAVVLSNGAPVEIPWAADVPAILEGYLGGQAGAGAIADILTGRVNPSGKLAETFPLQLSDTPARPFPGGPETVEYRESIYVGYRYYDAADLPVLFPFGHGLSYTAFAYHDLRVSGQGGTVSVQFKLKNTGTRAGKETAQVYVRDVKSTIFRPDRELKGFAKVELQPGEEAEITLTLDWRAFAYYDTGSRDWVVEAGDFEILVGASSRDLRLSAAVFVPAHGVCSPVNAEKPAAYYSPAAPAAFSQTDFEALLERPLPLSRTPRKGQYSLNTTLADTSGSFAGRQLIRVAGAQAARVAQDAGNPLARKLIDASIREMPLRGFIAYIGRARVEALLTMLNGHLLKGLWALIRPRAAQK